MRTWSSQWNYEKTNYDYDADDFEEDDESSLMKKMMRTWGSQCLPADEEQAQCCPKPAMVICFLFFFCNGDLFLFFNGDFCDYDDWCYIPHVQSVNWGVFKKAHFITVFYGGYTMHAKVFNAWSASKKEWTKE